MLLNFSNHPYENWPEKQKKIAIEMFGSIKDLEFPLVDPEKDEEYIDKLSDEYLRIIKKLNDEYGKITVHIMGEMTFCFALIKKLKFWDIPCVASTTRRNVSFVNNQKISEFEFVRFRYY